MTSLDRETILIRVSGPDQTGITSSVMGILANGDATVQDIEQIVVRGRLTLELVVDVPRGKDVLKDVLLLGWERSLDVDFDLVDSIPKPTLPSLVVSILGAEIGPRELEEVTSAIAKANGNIERITRLARTPVWCYEFEVHGLSLIHI